MTPTAKIGLFMLVALVVLGLFILEIEDIRIGAGRQRQPVTARFPSAAGIDRKAAVRIAGVRVGKVEEVRLDGVDAVLELSLYADVRLHQDASAQVVNMGILGDKYVEILPGSPGTPLLAPGTELRGSVPPSFDDVMRTASAIGDDVKQVTASLRSSAGGEQGAARLAEIIENIRELTASLKVLIAQNQANVNATTENFRAFSETLRDELPGIAEKMNRLADQLNEVVYDNRDNAQASLENIRELSEKLQSTADNLDSITGKIAAGEGSIGKLVNDDETVDNLNQTLGSIDTGVQKLEESLGRFDRFRLDMTVRGEGVAEADDGRYAFGFDLWTTDRRFFRIEGVDTPWGKTSSQTEVVTVTHPDGSTETTVTDKFKTEDKLAINAQIGYRLFPTTQVRAGIFESTGGFAVDHSVMVAQRPLRLTLEAYDFNRALADDPHLRLEGRFYITEHVFVHAGWDDPLYDRTSSVLFGGGVVWTDEDLKYSLGLAAGALN
ncbi:MAG TPA: MlaD family protein [Thermoanaerobaculales bacterium]|nr:MlaD family protein [Thermoanaerobaculales bacterium]HPA80837.1 MlaD family protein [Thermoanaerobaculales bacterium]HQL29870.1 MlaD family protein [Thermoanaerobaculales bacterium]HQP44431.1 MlaD family protein [Thermoanaerobaculales bacterium]